MQVWPAIDIRNGNCVRLLQGDYDREKVYGSSPADMAARLVNDGATGLHLVDLDGARDGDNPNQSSIAEVIAKVSVPCQLGGGIRSTETIKSYLDLGISRLVIGTMAIEQPAWLAKQCQQFPNRLLVGIDARDGMVSIEGWKKTSDKTAIELAKTVAKLPIAGIIYTDITRDGMLSGPNFDAMQEMANSVDVPVLASGGVSTAEDIAQLTPTGVAGCVVGRAIYEGHLTLQEAMAAAKAEVSG